MFKTYTTLSACRVRTSEGEACFLAPAKNSKSKPTILHNDKPKVWVKLPIGTKFQLCAKFEKTDTFMVQVEIADGKGGHEAPIGIILRRMSYVNLVGGLKEAPVVVEEPKVQAAAATITPEATTGDGADEIDGDTLEANAAADAIADEQADEKEEVAA